MKECNNYFLSIDTNFIKICFNNTLFNLKVLLQELKTKWIINASKSEAIVIYNF